MIKYEVKNPFANFINRKKNKKEKLALLNSIQVKDYTPSPLFVTCEDNVENRKTIMQLGYTPEDIQYFVNEKGLIEITRFAWNIADYAQITTNNETGVKITAFNGWYIK